MSFVHRSTTNRSKELILAKESYRWEVGRKPFNYVVHIQNYFFRLSTLMPDFTEMSTLEVTWQVSSGQSYKQFTLVIYDPRVVIWSVFQSGTTLES